MILVTVGTQLPFDRLVKAVDGWVSSGVSEEIIAQVGSGGYKSRRFRCVEYLAKDELDGYFRASRLIVAHAGMGSILTAAQYGKPIVVMPRLFRLGEHRNDHQVATAKAMLDRHGVRVAWDETTLPVLLSEPIPTLPPSLELSREHADLVDALREFILRG